jgi:glycosyltransferase involved in cell wall biosynthesis
VSAPVSDRIAAQPKTADLTLPDFSAWRIAVLIPCFNEEASIGRVVQDIRAALPTAAIHVYDNNSNDCTASIARAAGAIVRRESQQGKGNVVRRMFADVEADIYVLLDGDDTYDAAAAPTLVGLLIDQQLDMVNGVRANAIDGAYRRGHRRGNMVLTGLVRRLFGNRMQDILSGYRVFSRRFVKSFPALASGFETETEFTVHALELNMPIGEIAVGYRERPPGSRSKLNTLSDGGRILRVILLLLKEQQPFLFFGVIGLVLLLLGVGLSVPVIVTFLRTGLVPRLPTALLSVALVLLAFSSMICGLILDSVARGRKEAKRLAYLTVSSVAAGPSASHC